MANMQPNKSIQISCEREEKTEEFKVAVKLDCEADKKLSKIHIIKPLARVTQKDIVDGALSVQGTVEVMATYETDDGKIAFVKGEANFLQNVTVAGSNNILVQVAAKEAEVVAQTDNSISLNILVHLNIASIVSEEVGKEIDDAAGLVFEKSEIEVSKVLGASNANFSVVADKAIKLSESATIISREAEAVLLSCSAGIDAVVLEGVLYVGVLVEDGDELKDIKYNVPFKEEVECFGANPGSAIDASVRVGSLMAGIIPADGDSTISVTAEINSKQVVYATEEMSVISDAYSVMEYTNLSVECTHISSISNATAVQGSVNLSADILARIGVDEVIGVVNPKLYVSNVIMQDEMAKVEGVVEATIFYKNNMEESICSLTQAMPFEMNIQDTGKATNLSDFKIVIDNFKLKAGVSVEIDATIFARGYQMVEREVVYVSDIEMTGEERKTQAAIRIYTTTESDTLFGIAKQLGVTIETLLAQNPELENGVIAGMRVFVYIPLVANF